MKRIKVNLLEALAVGATLNLQLSTAFAQGSGFSLLTITNPTPAASDFFGWSVAGVGPDRVLIGARYDDTGASGAGAAYLFGTNGALLATLTNPMPGDINSFGYSVAAVGPDRVLIGANNAAYLFSTNAALLTMFTNPTPADGDWFGAAVTAVGTDRVLIGAYNDDTGAADAGAAYLFSTNGTLLTTFTNPSAAAASDRFGNSVAAVGTDRVLIGAFRDGTDSLSAGRAYLFSTNGALLTTFTNPTPAFDDQFARSVAGVGSDRVLIGVPYDDPFPPSSDSGIAYLFSISGKLLITFSNSTPLPGHLFGSSVAAVGSDRVLIGEPEYEGRAFLFSTNGMLLTTFTNPAPGHLDRFGHSVAAVGANQVVVGTPYDGDDSGTVYLFSLPVQMPATPSLIIQLTTTNTVAVSWPSPSIGWTLQENTNGVASVNWSNAPGAIQDDGTNKTLVVTQPTENRFYRLFKPGG